MVTPVDMEECSVCHDFCELRSMFYHAGALFCVDHKPIDALSCKGLVHAQNYGASTRPITLWFKGSKA